MKLKDYRPKRCNDTGNCVIHYIVYSVQLQQQFSRTSTSILKNFCKKIIFFFYIFFYFSKSKATIGVWWQGDEGSTSIIYVLIKKIAVI